MYLAEHENCNPKRQAFDRWHQDFDTEIVYRPEVGPTKVVALCSWAEAQRLVAILNAR